jgi:tetratricopeptide (TPR) repeat protein
MRIFPFGGCFLHHPVNAMLKRDNERGVLSEMGFKSTPFSLSANTNVQLLDFLLGEVNFPEWIKNIVYSSFLDPPSKERGSLIFSSDLALVGMSTPVELLFEGALLNVNRFEEVVISELSGLASERKLIATWKGALLRGNEDLRKTTSETLYKLIPQDTPEQKNVARFVLETTSRTLSTDEMTKSTAELRDRLELPMAFMLFNYSFMPDGRPVQWPAGFKDNTIEVARRLNIPTFDYAPFIAREGVDRMLMDDRRHLSAAAFHKLGELLHDFCLDVLDRPNPSKIAGAATEPEPAETSPAPSTAGAAPANEIDQDAGPPRRYAFSDASPVDFAARVNARSLARALRAIEAAWSAEDYAGVARRSRELLESAPDDTQGLVYLSRAAAFIGDWTEVARTGAALARKSPRDAFVAAGKLNRAGRPLEAAKIFAALEIRDDWFDAEVASMARKDSRLLLTAGMAAKESGDTEAEKVIWVAGARIAPQSHFLAGRVRELFQALKKSVMDLDFDKDPAAYISAHREMAWIDPSHLLAAARLAKAYDRSDEEDAIGGWLKVLAIEPGHMTATASLRKQAGRRNLEDYAIRGLVELGRDEASDPLILELASQRDAKTRAARGGQLRQALQHAAAAQRESDPEAYLKAWKDVLDLDPTHLGAVKRVIGAAGQVGNYPALLDAFIAHLQITPGDVALRERLAAAAVRAGQEQRALEYLAREGLEDLSADKIEALRKRVASACKQALIASDIDLALTRFRTLVLVDDQHPSLESLGRSLANGLASRANEAERRGDFTVAVLRAEQALEIVPDHPLALTLVARDFLRDERFGELVEFCQPRVKPDPAYDAVQAMLEKAMFAA